MTSVYVKDQKQMGCMPAFLHHFLTGKRPHLPPPPATEPPPAELPILESKDEAKLPWKFVKETPRLSLDSRATTDAKGALHPKQMPISHSILSKPHHHRSPSVIARLMGLDPLQDSHPELRRSASDSRVAKDLFQSPFITDSTAPPAHLHSSHLNTYPHYAHPRNQSSTKPQVSNVGSLNATSQWRAPQPRKSFYEYPDVFPEQKQNASSIYGEINKRLKMRGIDQPSKDLETLKQILEALQLKGLLHSKPPPHQNQLRHRHFIYDESPIVLIKPSRSPPSKPTNRDTENDCSPSNRRKQVRRNHNLTGETSPSPSPRRDASRSNSPVKQKHPLTRKRVKESVERRASPVQSPKIDRTGPDRSPRSKKPTVVITHKEKITTVVATEDSTSTDTERWKAEEFKEGKSLLERCDKLVHSIAEFGATDMQPSPVSVLDSSFYKDDSLTPSPVTTKRNIDFKDRYGESEEEISTPSVSPVQSKFLDSSDDCDFAYISDILRASHYLPEECDVFMLLEKQQHLKGNDTSKVSRLQRKLIFDTIDEILERDARLPPWKAVGSSSHHSHSALEKVWSEFQRIRECEIAEDLFETICRVLKKDLAVTGWGDCPVEMSEAVLDIERLMFKDMVCEIIEDLSVFSSSKVPRRKLVF